MIKKILFLIVLTIIFIISIFCINYYYGKKFHLNKNSNNNEYELIDIQLPNNQSILNLKNTIIMKGNVLKPNKNYNNAQGKKLTYFQLPEDIKLFYENNVLQNKVSEVVGEKVYYAGHKEKYRIFTRLYDNENDFLNWHYDNNFTKGNRYSLVIPILVSENNTSEFMIKDRKDGKEKVVKIPLGKGVIYNGSKTYHKITKQSKDNYRMVVIIPFYSNTKKNMLGTIREQFRNFTARKLTL